MSEVDEVKMEFEGQAKNEVEEVKMVGVGKWLGNEERRKRR